MRRVELQVCVREHASPVQQVDAPARLCGSVRRQWLFWLFSHPASVWMRLHTLQVGWAVYAQLRPVASSAVRPTAAHAAPACTCGASPTFRLQFACRGLSPFRTPAIAKGRRKHTCRHPLHQRSGFGVVGLYKAVRQHVSASAARVKQRRGTCRLCHVSLDLGPGRRNIGIGEA